ncbi:MAG: hypothetical protein H0U53_05480 [Actinobacteria bacterium]|nr:hypothetical protein [Actinomycetota bacterium]
MRRIIVVLALALVSLLVVSATSVSFATHKGNACPTKSHDPGGDPNCGKAPLPSPSPTIPPPTCPDVSGDVSGIIIEVAGDVGDPAGPVLIEVACLVYEITGL